MHNLQKNDTTLYLKLSACGAKALEQQNEVQNRSYISMPSPCDELDTMFKMIIQVKWTKLYTEITCSLTYILLSYN